MFIGLDRDTGRTDAATPATRSDAEQALREYATGTADEVVTSDNQEGCGHGFPPGVCLGDAIEEATAVAEGLGLKPDSEGFAKILEDVFRQQNPDFPGKFKVLGVEKIGGSVDFPFTPEQFEELVSTLPTVPGIFDSPKLPMLTPLSPPLFGRPSNPTIGGDNHDLPGLDELLGRMFGNPRAELSEPMMLGSTLESTEDDIDEERRGVVQDLAAAALNLSEQLHESAAEDTAAALRDIAALARDTYEI